MANERQTFTDPKTGEEIESTSLARGVCKLLLGLLVGLGSLWGCQLLTGLGGGFWQGFPWALGGALGTWLAIEVVLEKSPTDVRFRRTLPWFGVEGSLLCGLGGGVLCGLATGLETGLLYGLSMGLGSLLVTRLGFVAPQVPLQPGEKSLHHTIARIQHRRRKQRQLQAQWAHLPAGALSRATPPGSLSPTSTSLSQALPPAPPGDHLPAAEEERDQILFTVTPDPLPRN